MKRTMPIRLLGDLVLREPCREVEQFDGTLRELCRTMLDTMYEAPGVGLAAPQVGLSIRFFVYDAEGGKSPGALANPELLEMEGEASADEGCLSIPEIWAPTVRALRVRIRGQDLDGEQVELDGEELLARIFQHETDHLNGTLFIERLSPEERKRVMGLLRERELAASVRHGTVERRPGEAPRRGRDRDSGPRGR
jgi:peptide deformylase